MRIFGFLFILIGLAIAFGYPSYHAGFTNFEIGKYTIFEQGKGYEDQTLWLAPDDMPIDIVFSATADNDAVASVAGAAISVEIRNGETILRTDRVEFSSPANAQSLSADATTKLIAKIENFEVKEGALYTFAFQDSGAENAKLSDINMVATGIVVAPNSSIPTIGYALLGLGALIYLFGGRRRSKRVGNAPRGKTSKTSQIGRRARPAEASSNKPKEQKQKWGRNADE